MYLMRLWQVMADELAMWCCTSATRDVETARARSEMEGESFFTITLPAYCSDLERALDRGAVGDDLFRGFIRGSGGLPRFLSGFLHLIFDSKTGVLLDAPNHDAIYAVRQLTLLAKKIELKCSPAREQRALDAFVSCENELKELDGEWTTVDTREFSRLSLLVFGDAFDAVNREIDAFELDPRHGPGATADKLRGNRKYVQTRWPERLESVFPYGEYVLPSWRYFRPDMVEFVKPGDELPVKVTLVPKTLKTPRVIAIEPTAMQYMQQALMNSLVPKLESLTPSRYFVGFSDQETNKLMALKGSLTGSLATLDLSEASDRVLNSLVIEMLKPWPSLNEAVQACRTRTAELPDGRKIRLAKFASMGSALCFPMEAVVFSTLVFMGIQDARSTQLSRADIQRLRGEVRVYGDDIIVPVDCATAVVRRLEAFGLKVNTAKSFWTGKFRESCGGDYFDGSDVTPVRLKKQFPTKRQHASEIVSLNSFGNACFKRGLWRTADYVRTHLESILGSLPCVPHDSQAVGLHSFCGSTVNGWDEHLHKPLVKAFVPVSRSPVSVLDDHWALRKTLAYDWSDPAYDGHLLRAGRPLVVDIKRGWVPTTK